MSYEKRSTGLVRPAVSAADAQEIAHTRYGITASATELGSNQDRNFVLEERSGKKYVLRVDNPIFEQAARDAQHAALDAFHAAGVEVPAIIPGVDGARTQTWNGFATRMSEFIDGQSLVDVGYFAPAILREFGQLAADSVLALEALDHPGLDREHMWDMRNAFGETTVLAASIGDDDLRRRVISAAEEAQQALAVIASDLPVQAIHGDLTDDNVMGRMAADSRVHPCVLLDFGDLSYGWRIAELAVTMSSMLHHDVAQPLRALETADAFRERLSGQSQPMTPAESRALWPLTVLRAALLVASGWRQLEIDGENDYARERIDLEQAIFEAVTAIPLNEMTEHVLARCSVEDATVLQGNFPKVGLGTPLANLIPTLEGDVATVDAGVESEVLDGGRWQRPNVECELVAEAFGRGSAAVVFPYGQFRLTRARVDSTHPVATYPVDTEVWLQPRTEIIVTSPIDAVVTAVTDSAVELQLDDTWTFEISGLTPTVLVGDRTDERAPIGRLAAGERSLAFGLRRNDAPELSPQTAGAARLVTPERAPGVSRLRPDPAQLVGLTPLGQTDESTTELARRERIFASAQERYYERPMQIERGWQHHLIDTTGRTYIDIVNNVTGLGHSHPAVADAANRQLRLLGTNSRFLYRALAEYSERLLELLPAESQLDTVLLVNSGSEAVDLALRLAQAATGRRTIVALREAYHGWTMASDAVTTSAYDNPHALSSRPDWVHVADVPNRYRGTYTGSDTGTKYAADLGRDLADLAADGRPVAGFICESVLGNAGGVMLPDGYLSDAYARVREAGGLAIADEVQVGFGRMGSTFWGFEQSGVVPDIVTIAKPMGNGFPIGGVITSKRIADALADQGQFFSSAGGNPVSCQVGLAVLNAMRDEGLQENARRVGDHLIAGFQALAETHPLIGPIHGRGLYLGVELVRDRETLEPATAEAEAICERLRELGIIVLTTSERSNVLKVKPPLCLTVESADLVLSALDRVLTEGW